MQPLPCWLCACVLLAVAGSDRQLHMALPASVANVRDSGVGWGSAARESKTGRGGFGSCHLLPFEHGWENLEVCATKMHFSTSEGLQRRKTPHPK